jgi:hypothetical protein
MSSAGPVAAVSKELNMSSFVHTHYPEEHPGMARAAHAAEAFHRLVSAYDGARGLAALLLAAVVSAMLVVANQVIDTWTDGHLMAGWIALWVIAFGALALLGMPTRRIANGLRSAVQAWSVRRKQSRADARMWELALGDARVMADISRAMTSDAARDVRGYY